MTSYQVQSLDERYQSLPQEDSIIALYFYQVLVCTQRVQSPSLLILMIINQQIKCSRSQCYQIKIFVVPEFLVVLCTVCLICQYLLLNRRSSSRIKVTDAQFQCFFNDRYVLSTPMYNFSIPAVLKSYIDYIVRPRRTFAADNNGFKGLVTHKKMLVITARGSDFRPGSTFASQDFQEPFLRTVFNFIGITDIQFIHANALNSDLREQSLAEASVIVT